MLKLHIIQVGCGGTGGYLALPLSKFIRNGHVDAVSRYVLVDGDVVEPKNIARQNFFPEDIGMYKAQVLGKRYGVDYCNEFITKDNLPLISDSLMDLKVFVGCVDNVKARKLIYTFMMQQNNSGVNSHCVYFDAGNMERRGQVYVTTNIPELYTESVPKIGDDFLEIFSEKGMDKGPSCTELGDQTILANFMASNFLFGLLTEFIVTRAISTTYVSFTRHLMERNTDYITATYMRTL